MNVHKITDMDFAGFIYSKSIDNESNVCFMMIT